MCRCRSHSMNAFFQLYHLGQDTSLGTLSKRLFEASSVEREGEGGLNSSSLLSELEGRVMRLLLDDRRLDRPVFWSESCNTVGLPVVQLEKARSVSDPGATITVWRILSASAGARTDMVEVVNEQQNRCA